MNESKERHLHQLSQLYHFQKGYQMKNKQLLDVVQYLKMIDHFDYFVNAPKIDEFLNLVAQHMILDNMQKGDIIYTNIEKIDTLYFILEGEVDIYTQKDESDQEKELYWMNELYKQSERFKKEKNKAQNENQIKQIQNILEFYKQNEDINLLKKHSKTSKFFKNGICLLHKTNQVGPGSCLGNYQNLNQKRDETAVVVSKKLQMLSISQKQYHFIFGNLKEKIEIIQNICLKMTGIACLEIWKEFSFQFSERKIVESEIIYFTEDYFNDIYVIKKGSVLLKKRLDFCNDIIQVKTFNKGEIFGIESLFDQEDQLFDAQALEDSVVYTINKDDLRKFFEQSNKMYLYELISNYGSQLFEEFTEKFIEERKETFNKKFQKLNLISEDNGQTQQTENNANLNIGFKFNTPTNGSQALNQQNSPTKQSENNTNIQNQQLKPKQLKKLKVPPLKFTSIKQTQKKLVNLFASSQVFNSYNNLQQQYNIDNDAEQYQQKRKIKNFIISPKHRSLQVTPKKSDYTLFMSKNSSNQPVNTETDSVNQNQQQNQLNSIVSPGLFENIKHNSNNQNNHNTDRTRLKSSYQLKNSDYFSAQTARRLPQKNKQKKQLNLIKSEFGQRLQRKIIFKQALSQNEKDFEEYFKSDQREKNPMKRRINVVIHNLIENGNNEVIIDPEESINLGYSEQLKLDRMKRTIQGDFVKHGLRRCADNLTSFNYYN